MYATVDARVGCRWCDGQATEQLPGPVFRNESFELTAQVRVVGGEQAADVLGIELLGEGREADEVGEEDRHDLALLARCRSRRFECGARTS